MLAAKQLAKIMSLSPRTIWRLRSAGKLPRPITIGGSIRWIASDIDLFMDCNCDMQEFEIRKGGQR
ncbi:MAG: helix-turn-helix transcriptional regulator [Planctomycetota bacterium]